MRSATVPLLLAFGLVRGLLGAPSIAGGEGDAERAEFFEKRIRPALIEHCFSCHSADAEQVKAGLWLDSREAILRGGESGPAIVPGAADRSPLIRAIAYEDADLQMPPRSRLPAGMVADFRRWVDAGAIWPSAGTNRPPSSAPGGFDVARRRAEHWAWQPVARPAVAAVRDPTWAVTDSDRFILARLEAAGLRPAPTAEPAVLMRRLSFALTGLPPAPEWVRAFEDDPSPAHWERWIDRFLESPHYGERWARHWLDRVRYAETMGHEFDYPILGAWRYRDYVVRAFNADLAYDRFAIEQLAGDLLDEPRRVPGEGTDESRLATLQYWLCQQVHSPVDVRNQQIEMIDNQIDVVTKAFLGLTVSCARCHDHKFDAISTADFYRLYGILGSSRYAIRAVDDPSPRQRQALALIGWRDQLRAELADRLLASPWSVSVATADLEPRAAGTGPSGAEGLGRAEGGSEPLRQGERHLDWEGWFPDGEAFTADPSAFGQPVVGPDGAIRLVRPGWRDSGSLSRRFQGALRSPTFPIDQDFIHLRWAGQGARVGLVLEGFTLIRAPIYGALRQMARNEEAHWITVDVSMWKGRRAWLEFADLSAPDPASELPAEAASTEGWLAIGAVVFSPHREPPERVSTPTPPEDPRSIVERWRVAPDRLSTDEVAWLEAGLRQLPEPRISESLGAARAAMERAIMPPVLAGSMTDGTGLDEFIFIRGNPRLAGSVVARGFLEALSDSTRPAEGFQAETETKSGAGARGESGSESGSGSGRLGLARRMTAEDNPLFDRVLVNWVWAHLFGRGLVGSVDNFGALGERPTHPELLDFLAYEFRREGRSIKGLIRTLVRSRAWQMSSRETGPEAARLDPANHLWHRAEVRRLEGEAIRDAMLAVSGRLDRTVGGPPVPVHLTEFMEGRGRPKASGPIDGAGRRSLYLEVRRNFLSPWMLAFDTPVPATTVGRRSVSNVPAQALALMNDPLVAGLARFWAERLLREVPGAPADRVRRLYAEAYGRQADSEEVEAALRFVEAQMTEEGLGELAAWADLGHALLGAREFAFVP